MKLKEKWNLSKALGGKEMPKPNKERSRQATGGVTATREEVIQDIQEVMTLLTELEHEPHGGGRHATAHSQRLSQLVHTLQRELSSLSPNERNEYQADLIAILSLTVDGKKGRTLGEYLESGKSAQWGKEFASNWEKPQHQEAMRQEMQKVMEELRRSLHHRQNRR